MVPRFETAISRLRNNNFTKFSYRELNRIVHPLSIDDSTIPRPKSIDQFEGSSLELTQLVSFSPSFIFTFSLFIIYLFFFSLLIVRSLLLSFERPRPIDIEREIINHENKKINGDLCSPPYNLYNIIVNLSTELIDRS